jgi:Retrotransposon gag protein/Zinc knuckle
MVIQFLLSFMVGGLPEKFAANFINDLTDDLQRRKENAQDLGLPAPTRPNWGSIDDFELILESTFGDQNKKTNVENQLALLRQGTRTAEEYFQEFDQLVQTAGYQRNHDNVLVRYLHEQVKQSIVDKIYSSGHLPYTYVGWRTMIIDINGLDRRRAEQKKALTAQYSHKPTPPAAFPKTSMEKRTGTGVMYTGQGQKMDVDQAKAKGLCFHCGKPGHMARNCPDKPKLQVRTITAELSKEEKEELAKTLREEGFSGTQQ